MERSVPVPLWPILKHSTTSPEGSPLFLPLCSLCCHATNSKHKYVPERRGSHNPVDSPLNNELKLKTTKSRRLQCDSLKLPIWILKLGPMTNNNIKMAFLQGWRDDLTEDPDSVPSTHTVGNNSLYLQFQEYNAFTSTRHKHGTRTCVQANTYTHA